MAIFTFSAKMPLLWDKSKMYFNGTKKDLKFCVAMIALKFCFTKL